MIEAHAVTVTYAGAASLGPWDLDVEGPTLLTGASGTGKSTLLKSLAGILPAVQPVTATGRVRMFGVDPASLPHAHRPATFGWMPQGLHSLAPTVQEEVALPLEHAGWSRREGRSRVQQALDDVDSAHLMTRDMATLSGGETARVLLAAALAPHPRALLLDEPMSQLDGAGRRLVRGHLHRFHGPALIATHHDGWGGLPTIDLGGPAAAPLQGVPRRDAGPCIDAAAATIAGRGVTLPGLDIPAGAAVGISGPNGSGKTTLLHCLAGLMRHPGGVTIDGKAPTTTRGVARAKLVGLSFQDPAWHITQDTVVDEAAYTSRAIGTSTQVSSWLDRFGLQSVARAHPWDLSGGQRQRLAVVTALAHRPRVALLDEPTRGMDQRHRAALVEAISHRAEAGLTTLVATHDAELLDALPYRVRMDPTEAPG